jgi:OOP family OmpA-OmpF porin
MRLKMKTRFLIATALLVASGSAVALDGVYGAVMGSVVQRDPNLNVDTGYGAHLVLGIPLKGNLSLEPNIFYSHNGISSASGSVSNLGGGADLNYKFINDRVQPFVLGGLGVQRDFLSDLGSGNQNSPLADLGFGVNAAINQVVGFRGELRAYAVHYKNFPGSNTAFDFRLNLGLTFGGSRSEAPVEAWVSEAARPAAPAPVYKKIPDRVAGTPTPVPAPTPVAPCSKAPKGQPVDSHGCLDLNKVKLEGVNFVTASDVLQKRATALLDAVVSTLKAYPAVKVEIDGHTDSRNKTGQNQSLSERRAKSVENYLVAKGIAANRLNTKGFGSSIPVATNDTEVGRAKNRRVEFKVQ